MKRFFIILAILSLLGPEIALAATFDPNLILTDNDLENADAMSMDRVQRFLQSKGSGLSSYTQEDPWGNTKSAAQMIYEAGKYWGISQQYLLVRLQIEQSLVTTAQPTQRQLDWATGYAVCDSCSTSDPHIQKYKGFFNQVNWAARRVRESYLTDLENKGYTLSGWAPGITRTVVDYNGTYEVTPANNATAAMYTYTPHVYNANYNLWYFMNEWFTRKYPDGSLLQVQGESGVYLIQNGKRRPITSRSALLSRFDPSNIIQVTLSDLELYEEGPPIKFQNYSLVRSTGTGRVFLLDGDERRYIESPDIFRKIGFNPEEIIEATEGELSPYAFGANINLNSIHPTGVLLQSNETGGVVYVENGISHAIWSREILDENFSNRVPVLVDESTFQEYEKGDAILFPDGSLVTSPGSRGVYVISNGQKRGIASMETFTALGFKWENIIWTTDKALDIHPLGDPVSID